MLESLPAPACLFRIRNGSVSNSLANSRWRVAENTSYQEAIVEACLKLRVGGETLSVEGFTVICLSGDSWLVWKSEGEGEEFSDAAANLFRVLDIHQDSVLVLDHSGVVLYANKASYGLSGRSSLVGELFGIPIASKGRFEVDIVTKNQLRGVADMAVQNTTWNDTPAWLVTLRDVTELKLQEQQLRQAQKMEAVAQLAAGVAHEFNNLLMVIASHAELVSSQLPSGHSSNRDLKELSSAVKLASALANRLQTLGDYDRRPAAVPVHLSEHLASLCGTLERMLPDQFKLQMRDASSDELYVRVDPADLTQVVLNLVLNARDSMPDGGLITVVIQEAKKYNPLKVRGMEICVEDQGRGMGEGVRERAFEPFFSTKGPDQGTGLGLTMVYNIVIQYGGQVILESQPGQGSSVRVFLPLCQGPASQPNPPAEDSKLTVLLVDDHEQVLRATTRFLKLCGYRVFPADGAKSALDLASKLDGLDLLLTDVVMPGMNGLELADLLTKQFPELRVVFMSGYAKDAMPENQPEIGYQMLSKPFSLRDLQAKLVETLRSRNSPTGTE